MALINCSECQREVSDKAINCPNCGNPINSYANTKSKLFENRINEYKTANYKMIKRSEKSVMMFKQTKKATVITVVINAILLILFIYSNFLYNTSGYYFMGTGLFISLILVAVFVCGGIGYNTGKVIITISQTGAIEETGNIYKKYY